jgi:hypothetical protein
MTAAGLSRRRSGELAFRKFAGQNLALNYRGHSILD